MSENDNMDQMRNEKPFVYEEAVEEVRRIVEGIEKGTIPFEKLSSETGRAAALLKRCREELRKSEEEIMKNVEKC